MNHQLISIFFAGLLIISIGCNPISNNGGEESRYFEFTHGDSEDYSFVAKTSDPEVIEKLENQLELPFDKRNLHIHGKIERGNGGHNINWSWHFTPDKWDMVEISVEVCDGRPHMVEENLDYWIDNVGRFCPWSSRVVGEVDQ